MWQKHRLTILVTAAFTLATTSIILVADAPAYALASATAAAATLTVVRKIRRNGSS